MTTFDWIEYFKLAIFLARRGDEASIRAAISRAYYFAFNSASERPTVLAHAFSAAEGGSHERVWALYRRNAHPACAKLAMLGSRMKQRRIWADYKSEYPRCKEDWKRLLADINEFARLLADLDSELPKSIPKP